MPVIARRIVRTGLLLRCHSGLRAEISRLEREVALTDKGGGRDT
jgi:hypothetical protein